jgi:flagellar hook assembly protein FlgD
VDGVAQVPARFEAWLVDGTTKDTWNLREKQQARVAVLTDGATRSMQLVVGTSAYVSEKLRDLEALPRKYALDAPYPNPSSGPVAFQVGLPQSDRVTVEVYNILGQRIATLKDREQMTAGYHTVVWNAPRLASGLYFVRMEAGSYRETQKLMRVR